MSEITLILSAIDQGDPQGPSRLLELVYQELRRIAAHHLAQETPGQTLQPTALVHEAYLRLFGAGKDQHWDNHRHFFGAAAKAMREILVDKARQKATKKHGGHLQRVDLDEESIATEERTDEILAVHEALDELGRHNPPAARLVEMRYFGGFTHIEAASALELTRGQADDLWAVARARLRMKLDGGQMSKSESNHG